MANHTTKKQNRAQALRIRQLAAIGLLVVTSIAFQIARAAIKMQVVAVQLYSYALEVDRYELSPVKTNQDTEYIKRLFEERRVNFYESADLTIRWYSNLGNIEQIVIFLGTLAMEIYILYAICNKCHNWLKKKTQKSVMKNSSQETKTQKKR